jgi:hypothetical protein
LAFGKPSAPSDPSLLAQTNFITDSCTAIASSISHRYYLWAIRNCAIQSQALLVIDS